jgi:GvpD gas vesicle protein
VILRTPSDHPHDMPRTKNGSGNANGWTPIPDPEDRYSTGIPDFDRILGGGFPRGSCVIVSMDETVGLEDLDLLLFPTYLNLLYHSRGIIAVLPSRDSPHGFRSRLSRFVSRRRFDSRVRVVDYIGEDEGPAYVTSIRSMRPGPNRPGGTSTKNRNADMAAMMAAEKAAQGNRKKSFLELNAFEIVDTLVGEEQAKKMFFYGIKRAKNVHNLVIGLLAPGVTCGAAVRRMADMEFELHREDVGLIIRGVRPSFSSCVVTADPQRGAPHVAFVPRPS